MTSSPCTKVCKIKEGVCTGCHRTLEQIGAWGSMTDKERQEAMAKMGYAHPASRQAVSVPDDRISVHEYTARIALQALEEYAENLSIVAGWDYEPLEHHYAQQAIEDIQDKLTEQERGHD